MAYGTYMTIPWSTGNRQGAILIEKKDYLGSVYNRQLAFGANQIVYDLPSWEDHIVGLNCSFTLQNTGSTMDVAFAALVRPEDMEFRVTISVTSPSSYTLFKGFLNSELITQPYIGYGRLTLTASCYLSRLQHTHPDSIDTLQTLSLIDIIDNVLVQTGLECDIRVKCDLYETSNTLGALQTLFNKHGVYSELFWDNDVDRQSGYNILEKILASFECYLYWYDNYWYIERYENIGDAAKTFVAYTTGSSYGPSDSGGSSVQGFTDLDLHNLTFKDLTIRQSSIPGKGLIRVSLEETMLFNLILLDFNNATEINSMSGYDGPGWRKWAFYDDGDVTFLQPNVSFGDIACGYQRLGVTLGSYTRGGLITQIRVNVEDGAVIGAETNLTLTWKFATYASAVPGGAAAPIETDIEFRYYLRIGDEYILYDSGTDSWEMDANVDPDNYSGMENTIEMTADEYERLPYSYKLSVTIPLTEVDGLSSGEKDIMFIIAREAFTYDGTTLPASNCVIGDVQATVSSSLPDNVLEGETPNDFIEELPVGIELFDASNFYLKNAILCGTDYDSLSADWSDGISSNKTIGEMKLISKWRKYFDTMGKITGTLQDYAQFRPLRKYEDTEDSDRPYVLTSIIDRFTLDEKEVVFSEYNNTETITLT